MYWRWKPHRWDENPVCTDHSDHGGRMIESFFSCADSIRMSNREWGQIGTNYFRGLFALGFPGMMMYALHMQCLLQVSSIR